MMRQQSEPYTDEERAKWPYGKPQEISGILGFRETDHGNGLRSQEVPEHIKRLWGWPAPHKVIKMPWGIVVKV